MRKLLSKEKFNVMLHNFEQNKVLIQFKKKLVFAEISSLIRNYVTSSLLLCLIISMPRGLPNSSLAHSVERYT